MVRGLHHRQLLVFDKPAHGQLQERARRHVVAVKDRDKIAFRILQGIVDVACFRVFVSGTGDVLYPHRLGKLTKRLAATVVEDPDLQLLFRPVDTQRGVDRVLHHVEIFVIGRHEDVHRRPQGHILRQRYRLTVKRPHHLEVAEHQHNPRIGFGEQQHQAAHEADRIVPVERRGVAPPDVAAGDGQRQDNQHQCREAPWNTAHQQGHAPQQQQEDKLRPRVKRLGDAEQSKDQREENNHTNDKTTHAWLEVGQLFLPFHMACSVAHPGWQGVQPGEVAAAEMGKACALALAWPRGRALCAPISSQRVCSR